MVGTKLGPYEVVAKLGAGGMGEVYKAKDTRLDRAVAVKVLPAVLAADAQFRERFEREAKSISALAHPNICTLHDVGREQGVSFLVMELLEGQTLADRLAKGPMPLPEALKTATEIASALDAAHRRGIVHRDLKPGNVMLTKTGAKLLDFGLAKIAAGGAVSGAAMTALATSPLPSVQSPALTAQGTILGTFQYMAPEQIEGLEADARADIFAFGAVLYEMLTGQRAFTGRSQASLMSAIMKDHPAPVSQALPTAPPALDKLIQHCLAKDPDDRFQTAHDLLLQLKWIAEGAGATASNSQTTAAAVVVQRRPIPWLVLGAAGAALLALGIAGGYLLRPAPEPQVTRFAIAPPPKASFGETLAISPDGRRLAFVASVDGVSMVWIRALDAIEAHPIPGSEGAGFQVFWAPDSARVAFFTTDSKLKKASIAGGPVLTVCDASLGSGGTWNRDDVIVFAGGANEPLSRVAAAGGKPTPLTSLNQARQEVSHRWPSFLPDGRHFLYVARGNGTTHSIMAASIDDPANATAVLTGAISSATYAAPGSLMFVRDHTLMAQPFDLKSLKTTGEAVPIAENVGTSATRVLLGTFSVSDTGTLVYGTGVLADRQYAWFDRTGKEISRVAPFGQFSDLSLSPDGTRAAVRQDVAGNADIWVIDLVHGVPSRLTFDPGTEWFPTWTADGARVVFYSSRTGTGDIYQRAANGTGGDELVFANEHVKTPFDASRDGKYLAYCEINSKTKGDIFVLPLQGDRKPIPYLTTNSNELDPHFSPDGKWMAYSSDESGRGEIYIQSFPASGAKAQVSSGGGFMPRWRADGKELFYVAPDRKLMAVAIKGGTVDGMPTPLFETQVDSATAFNRYAAAADGQRFLVNVPHGAAVATPLTAVLNWAAESKK